MSDALLVSRITNQNITAVRVEAGTNGATYGILAALEDVLSDPARGHGYQTESKTGTKYGRMLKFLRGDDAELVAYPDDWVVVTDATYDDVNGWILQASSRVRIYGISKGQSGSAVDFVNTFTSACAMIWENTTDPPVATALANLTARLTIKQPVSANGPFQYIVTGPGTPGAFSPPDADGNCTSIITGLTDQASCSWTVQAKTTLYSGANKQAVSLPSNTITADTIGPVTVEEPMAMKVENPGDPAAQLKRFRGPGRPLAPTDPSYLIQ